LIYLYYLFILWLPFSLSRASLTFIGFFYGLCLDYFAKTPGGIPTENSKKP